MESQNEILAAKIIQSFFLNIWDPIAAGDYKKIIIKGKIKRLAGLTGKNEAEIEGLLNAFIVRASGIIPKLYLLIKNHKVHGDEKTLTQAIMSKEFQEYGLKLDLAKRQLLKKLGIRIEIMPDRLHPNFVKKRFTQLRRTRKKVESLRKRRPPRRGR